MFLRLAAGGPPELAEADDFTSLKVVRGPAAADADIDALGRRDGADVFIDRQVLLVAGRPDDPEWVSGLDAMIESVRRYGWVDDRGAVRAHIDIG